ncbi:MAG: ferritin [Myxococcales bacterium]|nr:MAG: ferritin [Myxococcales bacterium]
MLSDKMVKDLNDHLNFELYSAYVYFSMAAYLDNHDLLGAAHWMRIQVQEELTHVQRFYGYINDRDNRVVLQPVKGPATEWASVEAVFEDALKHEREVSSRINRLVDLATKEGDFSTQNFLQWFVKEQVEEEASVKQVLQQVRLAGKDGQGILLIDRDLAARVFTFPPDLTI